MIVVWYIVSLGKENDITNILFSQTSIHDYEELCSLDYLVVSENKMNRMIMFTKTSGNNLGVVLGGTKKPI